MTQETIEHTPGGPVIKIGDTWVFTGEWTMQQMVRQ